MPRRPTAARRSALVALTALVGTSALLTGQGPAQAAPVAAATASAPAPGLPSAVPAAGLPVIADGAVYAVAQVGSTVVVGGTFTATNTGTASSPVLTPTPAPYLMAFDLVTGAVRTSFAPRLAGGSPGTMVTSLLPGPVPGTVYVGGIFSSVGGVPTKGLTLLDVTDGSRVSSFTTPSMDLANVQTLRLDAAHDRLYVGGAFTTLNGRPHGGIASLVASTGAVDPFLTSSVSVNHSWSPTAPSDWVKAAVAVNKIDLSADGSTLVAIGNFAQVDGTRHDQVVLFDVSGTTSAVRPWNTTRFQPVCNAKSYDSYVRDVSLSPDGSFFVVTATGGYGPAGSLCDSASRWETGAAAADVPPTWIDFTGKDSLLSVAVTSAAVFVGGHQRWLNNPAGQDTAGLGAVPRPGVGALDPVTGLPLAWNPGRSPRGAGTWTLYATPGGLWMGSDTDYEGDYTYYRGKLAYFPLTGGAAPAAKDVVGLPADLVSAATDVSGGTAPATSRAFDGTVLGAPVAATAVPDPTTRSAVVIGRTLFSIRSDAKLWAQPLSGGTLGTASVVDPYNDAVWSTVKTGSGTSVYRGLAPGFFVKAASVTSLAYDGTGRLLYTRANDPHLYSRAFSPDSGVMGADETALTGTLPSGTTGGFLAGGAFYAVSGSGNLSRVPVTATAVVGPVTLVSGPSRDGVSWAGRLLYLLPRNQAPVASATVQCALLRCTADGSGSSDPDGPVATWTWTWGDGATSTGATATHDYAAAGSYQVGLTVTDPQGVPASAATTASPVGRPVSPIAFRGSSTATSASATTLRPGVPAGTQPGDALVLEVATSGTATAPTPPAGWTEVTRQVFAGGTALTVVWQKAATAADLAAGTVPVTLATSTKSTVQLLAWSGTSATAPVAAAASAADTLAGTAHPAPGVTVPLDGSWVVTLWTDKSSATTAWTLPAGLGLRAASAGTGTGYLTSASADEGVARPAGPVPGATATTDAASRGAVTTLVLAPAAG